MAETMTEKLARKGRSLRVPILILMAAGVTIVDPASTFVDPRCEVGRDTVVMPFTVLLGPARIGTNCRIGPFACVKGGSTIAFSLKTFDTGFRGRVRMSVPPSSQPCAAIAPDASWR